MEEPPEDEEEPEEPLEEVLEDVLEDADGAPLELELLLAFTELLGRLSSVPPPPLLQPIVLKAVSTQHNVKCLNRQNVCMGYPAKYCYSLVLILKLLPCRFTRLLS